MSTILQICQDAAVGPSLNLRRPITLFAEADEGDTSHLKLLRALTKTVKFLAGDADWQVLKREHTFTSAGTETEPNAFPSDFLRFVPKTIYDRTRHWELPDPLSPQDWQARKALLATTVIPEIIIAGDTWKFAPAPPNGDLIAYWYITNTIGKDKDGTRIARFTDDLDKPYFDDELVILGIEMNYRMGEGLDYAQQAHDFDQMRADRFKQDGGRKTIDMSGGYAGQTANQRLERLKSNAIIVTGV